LSAPESLQVVIVTMIGDCTMMKLFVLFCPALAMLGHSCHIVWHPTHHGADWAMFLCGIGYILGAISGLRAGHRLLAAFEVGKSLSYFLLACSPGGLIVPIVYYVGHACSLGLGFSYLYQNSWGARLTGGLYLLAAVVGVGILYQAAPAQPMFEALVYALILTCRLENLPSKLGGLISRAKNALGHLRSERTHHE
jgi:hypothetical protein